MSEDPDIQGSAVAGVIERPRLHRILDSPLVRVCVVQGPSGSGKTTLLRDWALRHRGSRSVMWVPIVPGSENRQAFWRHVASSATRLSALSPEAARRVDEQLSAGADPVRVAATELELAGASTLVFDGYEALGEAMAEIDDDLARLTSAVRGLRIMVATRAPTGLSEVDVPGGLVRVIALNELAFTVHEVGALIATLAGIEDPGLARSVERATHGLALTVRSVALALAQLGRVPHVDSGNWDAVIAARLESLLPGPVTAQFVADTSVAPYVDAELARQLTGDDESERLLHVLARNGFGRWIPYARGRPVFQYVDAIRDSFRARAAEDPERLSRLSVTTARWLFENSDADQALRFAIGGGDYAFADRIFLFLVTDDADTYITDRFLHTLRTVPRAALADHPMLAFGLGLALMANPVQWLEAPEAFRIAVDSRARPAYVDPGIDAFSLAGMRAVARREMRDFRGSTTASREAVLMVDSIPPPLVARYGDHIGTILRQLSYSLLQGGEIDEAIDVVRRSVSVCRSNAARSFSVVYAAGASAFAGDLRGAKAFMASIDAEAWPEQFRNTYLNGPGIIANAYLRLDELDFVGALAALRDATDFLTTSEFWPFLTAVSVSARHGLGQAQAEAERVTRALAVGPVPPGVGDNVATEHLHAVLARAWIAAGHPRAAAELLDARVPDSPYLASARTARLLAEGRDGEALASARALVEHPGHTLRTRADTWTTGAVAALRRGERDLAWSWLNSAVVTWETHGARVHVATMSPRDRRLLWELGRDRGSESVQRYLEAPVPLRRLDAGVTEPLTPRERVVLEALAAPGSIRQIAGELFISPHTVKSHLQGIYRKLGVSSRPAAVALARELGLLND